MQLKSTDKPFRILRMLPMVHAKMSMLRAISHSFFIWNISRVSLPLYNTWHTLLLMHFKWLSVIAQGEIVDWLINAHNRKQTLWRLHTASHKLMSVLTLFEFNRNELCSLEIQVTFRFCQITWNYCHDIRLKRVFHFHEKKKRNSIFFTRKKTKSSPVNH